MARYRVPLYKGRDLAVLVDSGARELVAGEGVFLIENEDGTLTVSTDADVGKYRVTSSFDFRITSAGDFRIRS